MACCRAFLIEHLIANHPGSRLATDRDTVADDYGDYCYYDGVSMRGEGMTRSVRQAFDRAVLQRYGFLIFLWKPDEDGAVRHWLDENEDEDEEEEMRRMRRMTTGRGYDDDAGAFFGPANSSALVRTHPE